MLKDKNGRSILSARWGSRRRSKGSILRIDMQVRHVIDQLSECDRRRWVSAVITDAFRRRLFDPVLKEGRGV